MASRAGWMKVLAACAAAVGACLSASCGEGNGHATGAQPKPEKPAATQPTKPDGGAGADKKPVEPETVTINVGGKTFKLELALTNEVRLKGLGQRTEIAADGGMLFGFRDADVRVQRFIMRDCFVDIDIIYLDGTGRVVAMHQMKKEEPRKADGSEGKVGNFDNTIENYRYESRLKSYSSRYPSQFVIELKGGTLPSLKVKEGDKIEADWAALKKRCK